MHTAKMMLKAGLEAAGVEEYVGYIGSGDSFRVEASTLIKYKGQRSDLLTPVNMKAIEQYIQFNMGAITITDIEADDKCVMDAYNRKDVILLGVDKDYYGTGVNFLNANRLDEGVIDCKGYGGLYRDGKGKVRGAGRAFFYFQVGSGDAVDNYKANSACDTKWGEVSAFNVLSKATNDREALAGLIAIYKKLYPEPKMFKGWRGDTFEIDWLYVLKENWTMARMLRWENDIVDAEDVLRDFKLL